MSFWEWIVSKFKNTGTPGTPGTPEKEQVPIENVSPVIVPPKRDLPWLDLAIGNIGKREGKDDKWIVELFKHTTYHASKSSTPWCAAFVSAMLERSGYKSAHSANAHAQVRLGLPSIIQPGCVLVWRHRRGSLAGHYHTNFLVKRLDAKTYICIGGNQANRVSQIEYHTDEYELIASRMPVKA